MKRGLDTEPDSEAEEADLDMEGDESSAEVSSGKSVLELMLRLRFLFCSSNFC